MSQSGSYNTGGGGGGTITTLTGNTGGAVGPTAGNINVVGSGSISVAGNPGTSTLTISSSGGGGGITTLDGDTGSATGSTVTIAGGSNINTSATGATVTVNLDNTVSISGSMTAGTGFVATTGDMNIVAGNLDLPVTNSGLTQGVITMAGNPYVSSDTAGVSVFIGANAGNPAAVNNIAIGLSSQATASGGGNVTIGEATAGAVSGDQNNALGMQALNLLTTGNSNEAIGAFALNNLLTGSFNIAIGDNAGTVYTSSESNNIVIGFDTGVVGESGVMRLGKTTGGEAQTTCYIAGVYGNTPTMSPQMVTIGSDGFMGSQAIGGGGIVTLDADTGSATGSTVSIVGGTGIATTATGSTLTITATGGGGGFTWNQITGSTVSLADDNGYILDNSGGVTATLPSTAAVGAYFRIAGQGSGGWTLAQNAGQSVQFLSQVTTTGTGGSITPLALPADQYSSLEILCITANTTFMIVGSVGNFTVT